MKHIILFTLIFAASFAASAKKGTVRISSHLHSYISGLIAADEVKNYSRGHNESDQCSKCKGAGSWTCKNCKGTGKKSGAGLAAGMNVLRALGSSQPGGGTSDEWKAEVHPCHICHGSGKLICHRCHGTGKWIKS